MQSVLAIVIPEPLPRLTTLARVKGELDIRSREHDAVLLAKIDEASSDIRAALGYDVASESVTETFRHDSAQRYVADYRYGGHEVDAGVLFLRRKAISAIGGVTLDDDALDATEYFLDADRDTINRLDVSGYPCPWCFSKSLIVSYTAGYVLPGRANRNLPPAIEGATVDLVQSFWFNRGRDPMVKTENNPGVGQIEYWVGSVGDPDQLPPSVLMKIASFRRPRMAVA